MQAHDEYEKKLHFSNTSNQLECKSADVLTKKNNLTVEYNPTSANAISNMSGATSQWSSMPASRNEYPVLEWEHSFGVLHLNLHTM